MDIISAISNFTIGYYYVDKRFSGYASKTIWKDACYGMEGTVSEIGLTNAFQNLSYMLNVHYDKLVIIIVDEYDTPIQQGYMENYYEKIVGFMRNPFSGAFKDNDNLAYGFDKHQIVPIAFGIFLSISGYMEMHKAINAIKK